MAKILESDPAPMRSLQPMTPASLERLVRACLAKDPDKRLQSAQDAKVGLGGFGTRFGSPRNRAARLEAGRRATVGATRPGCAGIRCVCVAARGGRAEHDWTASMQFEIHSQRTDATDRRIRSPDNEIAFAAVGADGTARIWIRELDSLDASARRYRCWDSPDLVD
jgi:hypothetical protein